MARPHAVAVVIGALGLLIGWGFIRALTGETGTGTDPYLETVGFALSTPGALVFLTYLSGVFRFETYYGERSVPGLFGDFVLSVLGALATGLLGTTVLGALTEEPLYLFLVGAALTFVGAFGTFLLRTRSYFAWDDADAASA